VDEAQAKLREIDDKLAVIRDARDKLARLDSFLVEQRKKIASDLDGRYAHLVRVSSAEIDQQVTKVTEILSRWQRR
jgi:hypothetical protein